MEDTNSQKKAPKSIEYPVNVYGDVEYAKRMAVDIGGSLAKLVYLVEKVSPDPKTTKYSNSTSDDVLYNDFPKKSVKMRFVKFETKHIESCLNFIQERFIKDGKSMKSNVLHATGGGAFKYMDLIKSKLGLEVIKEDEIDCIIKGATFLMSHVKDECFTFDLHQNPNCTSVDIMSDKIFPFLLVNIGSGVSIVKVDSFDVYQRVGGTSLGGGTFWGLGSLLTDAVGFDDLLQIAESGDDRNVDMLVKDIYGQRYDAMGLPGELVASSFGKAARATLDANTYHKDMFSQNDIANSLLRVISYTIGQIAYLYAQLHKLDKIFFGGYFIRGHPITMHTISFAVNYFSKGQQSATFFKHEGFLGALGAYTNGMARDNEERSSNTSASTDSIVTRSLDESNAIFVENLATTSFENYAVSKNAQDVKIVSLDCATYHAHSFPLIKAKNYPVMKYEYFIELISYFENGIDLFLAELQSLNLFERFDSVTKRYTLGFITRLKALKEHPSSNLETFHRLYDMRDNFISEYILSDPFLKFKQARNLEALDNFRVYINELDAIQDIYLRHSNIFNNLFAGSLVDLGSNEYLSMKQSGKCCNHTQALEIIQKSQRHYIGGDLSSWITRFTSEMWKKVVIFVDNSGQDIIYGVFGLTREFLKRGCEVALVANKYPSYNDIICSELVLLSNRIKLQCSIINDALERDVLKLFSTGFGSSCLDLNVLSSETCDYCKDADLVIIEGQTRGLVSNFYSDFICDSIILGTVSSSVLAKLHGFDVFDTFMKLRFVSSS